jgi:CelD/BcsL family acetyltransferase involved in cellulose biosynthesis
VSAPAVARTVDEVEALRPVWERMPVDNIDADIDHFLTLLRHRPEVVRPHVVYIEGNGAPPIMVVARLEDAPLETRIGYRVLSRPRLRTIRVAFGGVIGAETEDDRRRALLELQRPLRQREADAVVLPKLSAESPLCSLAREAAPRPCRDRAQSPTAHWTVAIPDSMEEFLAARSSRTRKNLRYYDKRMKRDHPDVTVRAFRDEGDLEELCADMERVAATTYQRGLGAGFTGDEHERSLMALGMRRGWFRAWVLYFGDRPVAFWHGYAYQGIFTTGCPGFDPEFAKDRVGAYLAVRMIEALCADDSVHTLDWGHGEADYKRTLGEHQRQEVDVLLFAPTFKGVRVSLVRAGAAGATTLAKRALGDSRMSRIRRAWRDRLARESA